MERVDMETLCNETTDIRESQLQYNDRLQVTGKCSRGLLHPEVPERGEADTELM